ncbi:helix-turn-helix domain-containing protein [Amycolatopsis aidingensis]|uniref:helix-turn-helix domain-containing protein n=1 Tax=Amycolatopsis aidingensis TaxID=2842453 RepID=UPI001C0ACB25|nr:helix-turn-helix transcriptional regulator [Amycolatopsis aidingensis]
MAKTTRPSVRQRRVARTLRRWRKERDAGTLQDVAGQLHWPHAKLSRFETATYPAGPAEIIALATIYGVEDEERDRVVKLAVEALDDPGFWRDYGPDTVPTYLTDYLETEAEATAVRNLEALLIPGLLQTAAYTDALVRAWLRTPDEQLVEERRHLRQQRQARLDDPENPLHLHAVVHESALLQAVGGVDTMAEQLDHLVIKARQPHITLQVLPVELGPYPGFGASYHLLDFGDGDVAAVYLENLDDGWFIEDEPSIEAYTLNFERVSELALDTEASARRIAEIRRDRT